MRNSESTEVALTGRRQKERKKERKEERKQSTAILVSYTSWAYEGVSHIAEHKMRAGAGTTTHSNSVE
jgi:hypothetical protein